MRVAVVGASGYLGSFIALWMKKVGHEVVGVFRTPPVDPGHLFDVLDLTLKCDVTDESFTSQVVACRPEVVVYMVSLNHYDSEKDYHQSINVNVAPLVSLGHRLSHTNNFKRLIYFSTIQVYGSIPRGKVVTEATPVCPVNMYGLSHALCEQGLFFLQKQHLLDSVSLRLSNGYGAPVFSSCDCWWLVLNDFCRTAFESETIQLKSDGSPQRDFVHLEDIARIIDVLAQSRENLPSVINLASGQTMTMLELAHLVAAVFQDKYGKPIPVLMPDGTESSVLTKIGSNDRFEIQCNPAINRTQHIYKDMTEGIVNIFDFLARTWVPR